MSVNLHVSVEVRDYDETKVDLLKQAIADVFKDEQLNEEFMPPVEFIESGRRVLKVQTDPRFPLSVSRSYVWVPQIENRLKTAITGANDASCEVRFLAVDADEN